MPSVGLRVYYFINLLFTYKRATHFRPQPTPTLGIGSVMGSFSFR